MYPFLLAAAAAIIVVLVGVLAWYNLTGWSTFSFSTGDDPSWVPGETSSVSSLRFKNCLFSVWRADGQFRSVDVSETLNAMAAAYVGAPNAPSVLSLVRPLNAFSFPIQGFNDSATVSDPSAYPWCTSPPAPCSTDAGCPYGTVSGACSTAWTCVNCPGAAVVTLSGSVRTV